MRGHDVVHRPLGSGLGHSQDFPALDVPNVFIMPSMNNVGRAFDSEAAAEEQGLGMMLEALRTQNCPAFPKDEAA